VGGDHVRVRVRTAINLQTHWYRVKNRKTKKERKVAGTKGAISAKIPEGTIIRTAEGELITESMIDIVGLETGKKRKAQKKYEKTLKNRGNLKK
jgi:hypothetical protein